MAQNRKAKKQLRKERGRGSIEAKGAGRWMVRVYAGNQVVEGRTKRKYVAKTVVGTYRQADQERTRMLRELDTGTFVPPTKRTLREFLTGYKSEEEEKASAGRDSAAGTPKGWLRVTAAPRVQAKTLRGYSDALRLHVLPLLGERKLDTIHAADIERLYAGMTHRELSPRSVRLVHTVLKNALKHAVRLRMLATNPCEYAEPPRQVRNEMKALSAPQVAKLLEIASERGDDLYALWNVLLMTGMRPAEARALKWSDLDGNHLRIQRAMKELANGGWEVGEPKTARSRRVVSLPAQTIAVLQAHRSQQAGVILAAGCRYHRQEFIFANALGNPLDQSFLRRRWVAALKAADLPAVRLYDTRHTHATLLLSANHHVKLVAERLGHSSVTLTLDTYSHVQPEMRQGTADLLERMFERKAG